MSFKKYLTCSIMLFFSSANLTFSIDPHIKLFQAVSANNLEEIKNILTKDSEIVAKNNIANDLLYEAIQIYKYYSNKSLKSKTAILISNLLLMLLGISGIIFVYEDNKNYLYSTDNKMTFQELLSIDSAILLMATTGLINSLHSTKTITKIRNQRKRAIEIIKILYDEMSKRKISLEKNLILDLKRIIDLHI